MSKLADAARMAEIKSALLHLLVNLSEDKNYTLADAIEDVKSLLREVDSEQYPFE